MTGVSLSSTAGEEYTQKCNGTGNKEGGNVELSEKKIETPLVWKNVIFFFIVHVLGIYGSYKVLSMKAYSLILFQVQNCDTIEESPCLSNPQTIFLKLIVPLRWACFACSTFWSFRLFFTIALADHVLYMIIGGFGITAGAHRLWAHRSYKAKFPLRVILALLQCIAAQNCLYVWVRDHRVHHKFTDTDADPHSAKRSFFFSHIGWLMTKRHPFVTTKGKLIKMKDLEEDVVVAWQRKFYYPLTIFLSFVLPTMISTYFFEVDACTAFLAVMARWTISLNLTWLINSGAHKWGYKPYDRNIRPGENKVIAAFVLGEGWHNYHHIFPFDYKTSELAGYSFNLTTAFIDFFAWIGWAYDLKTVSEETLRKRIQRTGDGTHKKYGQQRAEEDNQFNHTIWGWGDEDLAPEDINDVTIINKKIG